MENILTLGSPGTGKTHNLVEQINKLIDEGYSPTDITILSHTRVAAREIANRSKAKGVKASTIHAMAYSMAEVIRESVVNYVEVKEFSESIGIPMKGNHGKTDDSLELGDEYLSIYNFARATRCPLQWAYNDKGRPGTSEGFKHFCGNFDHWKKGYGFVDFNDMLDEATASKKEITIPALLIDEAQDLSNSQWKLIEKISKNSKWMLVTGDPDQALFTWGGASSSGMIDWAKRVGAKITELEQSYRVPIAVHDLSRRIITSVKNRYAKDYLPTDKEGEVNKYLTIEHFDFSKLKSALILYRNHALRRPIEEALVRNYKAYTCLNGFKSPMHDKYGMGVKAWMSIIRDKYPDKKDVSRVRSIATPILLKCIASNDLERMKNIPAGQALDVPYHMFEYYRRVDFNAAGDIMLSTIHGAKGMEHDNVIIINGMTQRVMDEAMKNPDPEYQVWYVAVTRTKNTLHIIDGEGVNNPL